MAGACRAFEVLNSKVRDLANSQGFSAREAGIPGEEGYLRKLGIHEYNNPKSTFFPAEAG